jgi:hypothetical protein
MDIYLDADGVAKLDVLRKHEPDKPSRNEMLRRIAEHLLRNPASYH